ncbi:MAG: hypothetical protein CMM60_03785 [Rhodospirillaceae bacterium]|nr:hypothetical protein [Rhodospirillaceae bacterium]
MDEMGFAVEPTKMGGISFGEVCKRYAIQLQKDLSQGLGKPIHKTYLNVISKWLIPYFKKVPIKAIDDEIIDGYERHRRNKLEKEPSKTTINTHNVVFRAVFDFAAKKKYVNRSEIPVFTVKNKGIPSKRRPDFSRDEYRHLYRYMRKWAGREKGNWITKYKRKLMREYVLFVANTGMRPGTEPMNLTWNCIEEDWLAPNGKTYIRIWVNKGKRGERRVIARRNIKRSLGRLREVTRRTEPDDKVFCMPDGSEPKDMSALFTRLLIDAELLYDRGGNRRTLYSLRHMYATFRLAFRNVDYRRLAKQMGTSVMMIEKHYAHDEAERYPDEFGI